MQFFTKMKSVLFATAALFALTTSAAVETQADKSTTKNEDFVGTSFTVPGTYIPGGTGSVNGHSGLKFRTAQEGGQLVFNVNEGYYITNFAAKGISNYAAKEEGSDAFIEVTKVEVDGSEVAFDGGKFPCKAEGNEAAELTISNIKAQSSIIFYFNNENMAGTQVVLSYEITYEEAPSTLEEGKYYLRNVAANLWWGAANSWGTHGSLIPHADFVTLHPQEDGTYQMETQVSNGGENYYFGGEWMDGAPVNLTITKAGKYWTIANGENFIGTNGTTLANGTQDLGLSVDGTSEAALWEILTEDDMKSTLTRATAEAPADATFLIIDHNFGRNNRAQRDLDKDGAWKVSEDCVNYSLMGGNSNKHCAESYHSVFTISQAIADVPNGVYSLTAQGFYRQDGEDNDNLASFFVNEESTLIPLKTGSENSMADACESFEKGLYKIDPIFFEVKDGQILVGIKNEVNANLWVIWDNFELTYYGTEADINSLKFGAIVNEVASLREKAQTLTEQVEVASVKAALQDALDATADIEMTEATLAAAVETLTAAVDKGEASVAAKNVLEQMKALTKTTNVYTDEALNEYYGQWEVKYLDGTLTKNEANALQNPFLVTGWHANITVDNLLLSAWDTNPDSVDAPYYINSWSVEGDTDGSDFKVPFFEYWTGDDNSLGERVLTATVNNVAPGNYTVSAWVRVRMKNGATAPAYGIALQANDGEAVDASNGAQVGNSQFFLKNVRAKGVVGEDGVLKIKFNVAADNNISWLSFKNVVYAQVRKWDFTNWSTATVDNLKAEAAKGTTAGLWSDAETADNDAASVTLSPENCYWQVNRSSLNGTELEANQQVIAETQGLQFINYLERVLAIAVNYSDLRAATGKAFGPYKGASYLWLNKRNADFFVLKDVKPGQTITMGVEPHKLGEPGGVELYLETEGTRGAQLLGEDGQPVEAPTEYAEQTWVIPAIEGSVDVIVRASARCHIYFIEAPMATAEEIATGIQTVESKANSLFNGTVYNLNGQKVEKAQKGLYIINGKKVVKR